MPASQSARKKKTTLPGRGLRKQTSLYRREDGRERVEGRRLVGGRGWDGVTVARAASEGACAKHSALQTSCGCFSKSYMGSSFHVLLFFVIVVIIVCLIF